MKFNSIVFTLLNLSAVYSATTTTTGGTVAAGSSINLSKIGDGSGGLRADSDLGMKLLSKARRLEDNNAAAAEEEEEEEDGYDITWVTGFSLKFLGCHYVQQYKEDGEQEQQQQQQQQSVDVQRLVHFRLCPNDLCRGNSNTGCTKKYGDYVVGMNTFMNVYFENQQRLDEYNCEMYAQNTCKCQDNGDDGYDEEKCEYDCFAEAGMAETCTDRNPYEEEGQEAYEFEVDRYLECAEFEMNQGGQRRRRMEEGGGSGLFIGPYCSEQGGEIHLGVFTDEGCSQFADKYQGTKTFTSLTGMELPYSSQNIVKADSCMSCIDFDQEGNNNNNNNQQQVSEMCEHVYLASGKCEKNLPSGAKDEPNNFACDYIDGVQTILKDGIARSKQKSNGVSTFFIIVLSLSTISLALYVRYLRTRLGLTLHSRNINLLEDAAREKQQHPPGRSQYNID
jgi:hypothetical protein